MLQRRPAMGRVNIRGGDLLPAGKDACTAPAAFALSRFVWHTYATPGLTPCRGTMQASH